MITDEEFKEMGFDKDPNSTTELPVYVYNKKHRFDDAYSMQIDYNDENKCSHIYFHYQKDGIFDPIPFICKIRLDNKETLKFLIRNSWWNDYLELNF